MLRRFSLPALLLAVASTVAVVGCGGGGGEAEFVETTAQTAEEISEAEAYEKQMEEDRKRMAKEYN